MMEGGTLSSAPRTGTVAESLGGWLMLVEGGGVGGASCGLESAFMAIIITGKRALSDTDIQMLILNDGSPCKVISRVLLIFMGQRSFHYILILAYSTAADAFNVELAMLT